MSRLLQPLRWLLTLLLAAVFAFAGATKLFQMQKFAASIGDFGLVWTWLEQPLALALPLGELLTALLLLLGSRRGLWLAALQLLVFTGVVGYGLAQGLEIDCGCFGLAHLHPLLETTLSAAFARNLILLGVCAALRLLRAREHSRQESPALSTPKRPT